ncbi:MAG: tetratricopeptide repeat protein [Aliifodinibius sp.]|nr:tetratricopeptide repeat protein [Fodinibius sp.]NIV09774.1 tetratricopeptide repeat protein [Fodinibius sp.]NIY23711.1 tetratricopeptide repeat protein [Fodinibius sp.]
MRLQILNAIVLLIFVFSCEGVDTNGNESKSEGGSDLNSTAKLYEDIKKTTDDNLRLSLYNKIIEIDPQDSYAYYGRAAIYKKLGQYDNAIQDFRLSIRVDDPNHPPTKQEIYCDRGDVNAILGKHYNAIEDYSAAIAIDPKFSRAYQGRADSYLKLGKHEEAARDQQTVKALLSDTVLSKQ